MVAAGVLAMVAGAVTGCGGGSTSGKNATKGGSTAPPAPTAPVRGGSLTVLENSATYTWRGLDPALVPGFKAQYMYPNAIYGGLFEQGVDNQPVPDLATGYKVSADAKTATITLRHGVTFTDGTPFNAEAVKWNIERDLAPSSGNACQCTSEFPVASIDTPDAYTVVMHLKQAYSPIIQSFYDNAPNWILSPTAVKKEGAKQFSIMPVGAGPFKVASDVVGSTLKLVRNPDYWAKGKPYLDSLTFNLIGSDQGAYEAIQAGQAQAFQALGNVSLALQAKKTLTVVQAPQNIPLGVELNSTRAPFDNMKAREAIYYATDPSALNTSIQLGQGTITQSPSGPDCTFYEPKVPGYRTYNLAKAKALVSQIGGLNVEILGVNAPSAQVLDSAIAAQWSKAGIKTTLNLVPLDVYIGLANNNKKWESQITSLSQFDPAIGFGFDFRFQSNAPFSGTQDPTLDNLIAQGLATADHAKRKEIYFKAFKLISDKAYAPALFGSRVSYTIAARSVHGPGLSTSGPEVFWEDVFVHS